MAVLTVFSRKKVNNPNICIFFFLKTKFSDNEDNDLLESLRSGGNFSLPL